MKGKVIEIGRLDAFHSDTTDEYEKKFIGKEGKILFIEDSVFNGMDDDYDWKFINIIYGEDEDDIAFCQVKVEITDSNPILRN